MFAFLEALLGLLVSKILRIVKITSSFHNIFFVRAVISVWLSNVRRRLVIASYHLVDDYAKLFPLNMVLEKKWIITFPVLYL